MVVFVLMLYIPSDDIFIKSDGGDKIPSGPKRFLFVQSVLDFNLLLEPSTALPLDDLHGVGNTVSGALNYETPIS